MEDTANLVLIIFFASILNSCSNADSWRQSKNTYSRSDPIFLEANIEISKEQKRNIPDISVYATLKIVNNYRSKICIPQYYFDEEDTVFDNGIAVSAEGKSPVRYKSPPLGQIPRKVSRYVKLSPKEGFIHKFNISKIFELNNAITYSIYSEFIAFDCNYLSNGYFSFFANGFLINEGTQFQSGGVEVNLIRSNTVKFTP
ncbi:MAG: hypothetical protein AAFY41_15570 [Bacteroidota bacterium]